MKQTVLAVLDRLRYKSGKEREETLEIRSLNNAKSARARKGKALTLGFKPTAVVRVV